VQWTVEAPRLWSGIPSRTTSFVDPADTVLAARWVGVAEDQNVPTFRYNLRVEQIDELIVPLGVERRALFEDNVDVLPIGVVLVDTTKQPPVRNVGTSLPVQLLTKRTRLWCHHTV